MDSSIKLTQVALVGNPNVGKSLIFNYLSKQYVDVSNYPGTTIQVAEAVISCPQQEKHFNIIDTPGVYSISSFNDEELATRDYVLDADLIVNVLSATTLSRDLFLTAQLKDMGKPMLVVLNQIDELRSSHIEVDIKLLARQLGLEILPCSAHTKEGLSTLQDYIFEHKTNYRFKPGLMKSELASFVEPYQDQVFDRAEALMIAEGDKYIAARNQLELKESAQQTQLEIYDIRRAYVDELVKECIQDSQLSWLDKLGNLCMQPVFGTLLAMFIIYVFLYQFLGLFVAGTIVDFFEINIFHEYFEPACRAVVGSFAEVRLGLNELEPLILTDPLAALGTFLAGDYGVLTLTTTYLLALLLPLVVGFYFGLALLEDSGYLPRLAVLLDGVLSRLGMNGRAVIPLILGGGCVTMATVTTRLLATKKEKLITMALLGLTIPCSAQLGVIQGLLGKLGGPMPWLVWGGVILLVFILTGLILKRVLPGENGHFISDIPPMRIPDATNVIKKTAHRSQVFMLEAIPAFFTASALVAGLQVTGLLKNIIIWCEPLVADVLLLPKETTLSFILGMVRRDFGAFGLKEIALDAAELVTVCIVLTLFVPCIATVAVMIKERSLAAAASIWLASWILALGIGFICARALPLVL
jgi:ferrous iron transport protein B